MGLSQLTGKSETRGLRGRFRGSAWKELLLATAPHCSPLQLRVASLMATLREEERRVKIRARGARKVWACSLEGECC